MHLRRNSQYQQHPVVRPDMAESGDWNFKSQLKQTKPPYGTFPCTGSAMSETSLSQSLLSVSTYI